MPACLACFLVGRGWSGLDCYGSLLGLMGDRFFSLQFAGVGVLGIWTWIWGPGVEWALEGRS